MVGKRWSAAVLAIFCLLGALVAPSAAGAADEGPDALGGGGDGEAVNTEDGYVWHSNGGGSATYPGDGSSTYRYNPTGQDIVVNRTAVGRYTVSFGSSIEFIPTVTAYGSGSGYCKIGSFAWPGNFINVACYNAAGVAADSPFTARWTSTLEDAYMWVDSAGNGCGLGDCENNPWGGAITTAKTATGVYTVTTPGGPGFDGGLIQVTAYGSGANTCNAGSWGSTSATVRCYNSSGAAADSAFTFLRIGSEDDAYAWANNQTSTTEYNTSSPYAHNPQGVAPTSQKTSTGAYTVRFDGLRVAYGGNVLVTSYVTTARCKVSSWSNTAVNVRCHNAAGAAADARFDVLFTRFQLCDGRPANVEVGNNLPTNGNDIIVGTAFDDDINALDGSDLVCGGGGNDFIIGGPGNDRILGGAGDDLMSGNAGNDIIFGEAGNDTAYSGSGNDTLIGGPGNDVLGGSSGFDVIDAGIGNDIISGGSDTDGVIQGGDGNDAVNGGGGADSQVFGGNGDDTVSGNGGNDIIYGGAGNDEVRGGPGNDSVFGEAGNDFVAGNDGTDTCNGGTGTDTAAGNCETIIGVP